MKKVGILAVLILILATFLRLYRSSDLLGFWYDQGRDALVVWDIWKNHKLTLIGPTTGIEGIFLGPFYYYLITPFYILGRGNPIYPAAGLVMINVAAIYLIYRFAVKFFNPSIGLLTAFLISISYYLVSSHRWLSNPTPLPLFSVIAVWTLVNIISGQKRLFNWLVLGLSVGISLHFEAASAVFFIPAVLITFVRFRKNIYWHMYGIWLLSLSFFITLIPQIIFDFRHHHILFNNFRKFLVSEKSFIPQWSSLLISRLEFFYTAIFEKLAINLPLRVVILSILGLVGWQNRRHKLPPATLVILIWIITPLAGLLLYSGNKGYVWSYYLTGIYPFTILLVSVAFHQVFLRSTTAKVLILCLIGLIILDNTSHLKSYLTVKFPEYITLSQSVGAVDWVYRDSEGQEFNYDVYVPPVIYAAYDYLFLWRGTYIHRRLPQTKLVTRLYTLYEPDRNYQVLLNTWIVRQMSIGSIEETQTFGNVTAQRRHRFSLTNN